MKKPGVSNSKKGAIFNILWLLIENPHKLDYFRQADIKNQLIEEFGINLDRKTIQDYLDILGELKLPYEISHENNKGYYISKRMVPDHHRELLLQNVLNDNELSYEEKKNYFEFITYDCSFEQRKNYMSSLINHNTILDVYDYELNKNLQLIEQAISEHREITFEYLNFDKFGKLISNGQKHTTVPIKIGGLYGNHILYNAQKFWGYFYTGTKIKYIRNIELGDVCLSPVLDEKIDYKLEVFVIYEWSIEFIVDHFDRYELIREKDHMRAIIYTSYEFALDWCKKYALFFIINDEEIREFVLKDMQSFVSNYKENDVVAFKIKAAIVDYFYKKSISEKMDYFEYIKGLYKYIDFELETIGCTKLESNNVNIYEHKTYNLGVKILECFDNCPNYSIDKLLDIVQNGYDELKCKNVSKKVMVLLFDELSNDAQEKIIKIVNKNPFVDIHNKFPKSDNVFFYKYLVFYID